MDLWVVAAAAGAGYFGKHMQNLSLSEKEKLIESYSKISNLRQSEPRNILQQIREKTCPLRRLVQKGVLREPSSEQNDVLDRPLEMDQFGGHSDSLLGLASTSESARMVEDVNVLRLSSPTPGFCGRESCPHNTWGSCRLCRYKLLKSRPSGHVLQPLGSYLQKVDEHVHISLPTPLAPTMGPVLISDGNVEEDTTRDAYCACNEDSTFSSVPSSSKFESVELPKQVKGSQERTLGAFDSPGPPSGMLLFLIGLTIGKMPKIFTYRREIKKLNEQLKQAENLVQDLQEELDMKDKLTVKELAAEGSQTLSTKGPSSFSQELTVSCFEHKAEDITNYVSKMANNKKSENPYLMSEIEAELEAELERLGLNMDMERTTEFVELDSQYEVDTIQEDIKLDSLRRHYDNASKSESEEESGTTNGRTPPANYAVSPRELSIRLHEVIESRLEARIKELETALQNNQNKFHFLETQCITSLGSACRNGESLSTPESPHAHEPGCPPLETKFEEAPNCTNNGFATHLNNTEDRRSSNLVSPWEEHLSRSNGSNEDGEFDEI
ncbi:hypothetical protein ACH5RR_030448 [Cinchona calisaya]|uniref:Uncharacterized protein n=1 Tax=Cinchona calisaya TaxID=153742 RepID=A0ABD2YUM6_9GENT